MKVAEDDRCLPPERFMEGSSMDVLDLSAKLDDLGDVEGLPNPTPCSRMERSRAENAILARREALSLEICFSSLSD